MDLDIQATFTNRDSNFWDEEVVEFFVAPKDLKRYFELQWNPLGGVFDAIIQNDLDEKGVSTAFHGDWTYTAKGMSSAVKVKGTVNDSSDKDQYWQVEVRLPFADLREEAPKPGTVWRANFYRMDYDDGKKTSWDWARVGTSFHEFKKFGTLVFE